MTFFKYYDHVQKNKTDGRERYEARRKKVVALAV